MRTIDQAAVQAQLIGTEGEREEGYNRLFGDKPEVTPPLLPGGPVSTTRIYIIQWALGSGKILCCDAKINEQGYAGYIEGKRSLFIGKTEYRLSEEEARKALEEKRSKKLKSLDKQMKKVSAMQFKIEEI